MEYTYKLKKIGRNEIIEDEYKKAKSYFELYLLKNYSQLSIPNSEIEKIVNLVNGLFSDSDFLSGFRYRSKLSVIHPSKFERYSAYKLLEGSLSEIEFSRARTFSQEEFHAKINEWVDKGLSLELQRRFEEIRIFDNKEDFEKIIRGIFYMTSLRMPNPNYSLTMSYDAQDLLNKMSNYNDNLTDKYYQGSNGKELLKSFLKSLFSGAKSPYLFESSFIRFLNDQISPPYTNGSFLLTDEELKFFLMDYLNKYMNEVDKVDNNLWSLYHNCSRIKWIERGGGSYRQDGYTQLEKANKIVIDFIQNKDLDGFLLGLIQTNDMKGKFFYISDFPKQLFADWENFKLFLNKQDNNKWKYLQEFKQLLIEFESKDFKNGVEFIFKDIPIQSFNNQNK